jgi:polyphosphate kinase 2 (PPK2 family)
VFRVVALPAPTERQKSQMYMQRYVEHFPAAGGELLKIVLRARRKAKKPAVALVPAA